MKIVTVSEESIAEAAKLILDGGTAIYPTETAYALGADPFQTEAVRTVFALKERDAAKPLGVIAASVEQVRALCEIPPEAENLFQYWPGALSILLPLRPDLDANIHAAIAEAVKGNIVSIRVSPNPVASAIATLVGHPIIATSANKSGAGSGFSAEEIARQFTKGAQPDMLVDGGTLPQSAMSTIVRIAGHAVHIVRSGAVAASVLRQSGMPVIDSNSSHGSS